VKNREEGVYIINLVARLTVLYYTLSRFWRNSAKFNRLGRIWQKQQIVADCGGERQIAADCGGTCGRS